MIDRSAFHQLSYGLYIVTAVDSNGRKVGCVANTFQQVASEPPIVSVSLNKDNTTTKAIIDTGKFAVSVLDTTADMELIGRFGFRSSLEIDKFEDTEHTICEYELPRVKASSVATFAVEVRERVDVGTHYMFIGPVVSAEKLSDSEPMTYSYYHQVLKGKTPPKAASYDEEIVETVVAPDGEIGTEVAKVTDATTEDESVGAKKPRYGWRCKLCGYIEMVDELPDDFVCPICGVGKDMFERIEL